MSGEFIVMLGLLVALALMGVPIGLTLICSSIAYIHMRGLPLTAVTDSIMQGFSSNYIFLAIPLFILAARIMNAGSITDRMLDFAIGAVGHMRGGLSQVNVLSSLIFSGMSGSATADAAGVGSVLVRMMRERNRYPGGYAGALTAASSVIGPIFPPSIPMIYYAISANASVGSLFLGGVVPALIIAGMLMALCYVIAIFRGFPTEEKASPAQRLLLARRAILPLLTPAILLGGIYSGIMTPTEAAAVAVAYAGVVSLVIFRAMGARETWQVLVDSAEKSAVVVMILAGAFLFGYVVAIERLPNTLAAWVGGWDMSPTTFLLMINLMFLGLGMFLPAATILLVIVPVVVPATLTLGIDPIHFGVIIVINTMIGLVTPPYGVLIFVVSAVNRLPTWDVIREILPFIAMLIASLVLLVLFPELVLFVPEQFGYRPI
ncbi:TRAP transporter large permease [Pseudohoeflea coraliihabitans]|uniref:TRAP transporter large permease protein n=1 Tax=Pseudohoeflea coraliihabitans TaxID=2860393 RepID=A0ABS6WJB3_9HYPH|nr:TRAP transporter large permease [Pseudohoeflea sp. DP4N28-3]MBW3096032.1 TRAP transporter large permease [Pseudohoeflea sp. DP4N28-3]